MYFNEDAIVYLVIVHKEDHSTVSVFDSRMKALISFQNQVMDSMYRHSMKTDCNGGSFSFCTKMGRFQVNEKEYIALAETETNKTNEESI